MQNLPSMATEHNDLFSGCQPCLENHPRPRPRGTESREEFVIHPCVIQEQIEHDKTSKSD